MQLNQAIATSASCVVLQMVQNFSLSHFECRKILHYVHPIGIIIDLQDNAHKRFNKGAEY